jgi:group I intron endonuclease
MADVGYIYRARNIINDKCYIGLTIDPIKRISEHLWHKDDFYFQRAINKYGNHNFEWDIIESDIPLNMLKQTEIDYIILFKSFIPNGYNLTTGGEGCQGRICSDITKAKIGKAHKGKKRSDAAKLNMSNAHMGHKPSEETKRKMSESQRNRKRHSYIGRKISATKKGVKGKSPSPETRVKLSLARKGRNNDYYRLLRVDKEIAESQDKITIIEGQAVETKKPT